MSDKYQTFVPTEMHWQPDREKAEAAVALLWSMAPVTQGIEAGFSDKLQFHDPMRLWSGVRCPACSGDLSRQWFNDAIVKWYETQSDDMKVVMPCCEVRCSLDALEFNTPAAFSKFWIQVTSSMTIFSDEQIEEIEACLGIKLKLLWSWL